MPTATRQDLLAEIERIDVLLRDLDQKRAAALAEVAALRKQVALTEAAAPACTVPGSTVSPTQPSEDEGVVMRDPGGAKPMHGLERTLRSRASLAAAKRRSPASGFAVTLL